MVADLEKKVIACLLLNNGATLTSLEGIDFEHHQDILTTVRGLAQAGDPIDPTTVHSKMGNGIAPVLSEAMNLIPTSAHFNFYLKDLKKYLLQKAKNQIGADVARMISSGNDPVTVAEFARDAWNNAEERYAGKHEPTFRSAIDDAIDLICNGRGNSPTVKTCVPFLDRLTKGGLSGGDNHILAARPSQGKTAMLLQILIEMAMNGTKSVFFSLEMTRQQLAARILAYITGLDAVEAMKNPEHVTDERKAEFRAAAEIVKQIADNITLYTSNISMPFVMKKSREAVGAGAKIIALDYLQLMEGQGNNRNAEVEKISRSWKNLLKELDVPGIALSQLSRNLESEGRRPRMSDLRDSGSIEQDADVIWMLHREKDNSGNEHTLLLQEKGRQIGRGYCDLMFAGSWQRFNEIERE